ncbi:MAG: alkaline phosphatase family protein [Acidimicrobiia bacterium]
MDRREFLRRSGLVGGGVLLGGPALLAACSDGGGDDGGTANGSETSGTRIAPSVLDMPARDAPIDTVVVVMMENRSFDHYLGWLATNEDYLEAGRSRYGEDFSVNGRQEQAFPAPDGKDIATYYLPDHRGESNPYRGCGHPDPGHGWDSGRAQRDGGFLAPGSGNDQYALGYYRGADTPFTSQLLTRFAVFDRWNASLLAPTYPNREYLHSGTSGGNKANVFASTSDGFQWPTIWDRLAAAGVPNGYYYVDLPTTALWGPRLLSISHPIDQYFADAEAGTLPNVVFVDPGFLTDSRTDDHPHADIRAGQRFLRDVFSAFESSPSWPRGVFVLTYDEWGGFFDHVTPPQLPDDMASSDDANNFGQAGFRVPAVVASPFARRGYVEPAQADHTAVLRFLEWRFLGAPPEGPGNDNDTWFLTTRDRNALNLGVVLTAEDPDPDPGFDLNVQIDPPTPGCTEPEAPPLAEQEVASMTAAATERPLPSSFEVAMEEGEFERMGHRVRPSTMARQWVA